MKFEPDQRAESGDGYTPAPLVSTATTSHFPVPTLSSTITVVAPTHHHNNTSESWSDFHPDHPVDHVPFVRAPPPQQRKRCRDYDGDNSALSSFKVHFYGVLIGLVLFFRKGLVHERRHVSL